MVLRVPTAVVLGLAVGACRGHPPAYSARALGDLRTAHQALREYRDACGAYPATLEALRPPTDASGVWRSCTHFDNLDGSVIDRFAAGLSPRDGQHYVFLYVPAGRIERGFERYEMEARWLARDRERRSFWMSEAGVLRSADGRPANERDEPLR